MVDQVVAKFRLAEMTTKIEDYFEDGKLVSKKLVSLVFYPVVSGSEENKKFWRYTPSGKIELGTVNQDAVDQFELRKEYYVTFTEATPNASPS